MSFSSPGVFFTDHSSALISKELGEGKKERANRLLSMTIAVLAVAGVLVIENTLAVRLCFFIAVLVLIRMAPALSRIAAKKEDRLSFEKDISYKFDEKI